MPLNSAVRNGVWAILVAVMLFCGDGTAAPVAQQLDRQAASTTADDPPANSPPLDTQLQVQVKHLVTSFEFWLSVMVLLLGLAVLFAEYRLLRQLGTRSEDVLKVFGITLIIVAALFSITAGFSANQVAPAMGLFGTIAGYMLGRRESRQPIAKSDQS
jgi:hypothetical protein